MMLQTKKQHKRMKVGKLLLMLGFCLLIVSYFFFGISTLQDLLLIGLVVSYFFFYIGILLLPEHSLRNSWRYLWRSKSYIGLAVGFFIFTMFLGFIFSSYFSFLDVFLEQLVASVEELSRGDLIGFIFLLLAGVSWAKTGNLQFRWVMTDDEAKQMAHDTYAFHARPDQKSQDFLVGKEILLTASDIESILITRQVDAKAPYPRLDIFFNKDGAAKLKALTKDNLRKEIAIVWDDALLSAPYIIHPINTGHIMLSSWKLDTDQKAEAFVKELGLAVKYK